MEKPIIDKLFEPSLNDQSNTLKNSWYTTEYPFRGGNSASNIYDRVYLNTLENANLMTNKRMTSDLSSFSWLPSHNSGNNDFGDELR